MEKHLFEKLIEYSNSDIYPFCMPGHKRANRVLDSLEGRKHRENGGAEEMDPYKLDITEVEGFDNLHNPSGILKNITDRADEIYKSLAPDENKESRDERKDAKPDFLKSFMSVNGSTALNLAAINAIPDYNAVLAASNCHISVKNAAKISNKKIIELEVPTIEDLGIKGGISADDVEKALKNNQDIKAVVITSPSYDGFISDVKTIAEVVHNNGAYLIVDEAHGAHLPFCKKFPTSALYLGADIVIHSLHKTLGSLNQTALGFVMRKELEESFKEKLLIFTTTSSSYILMASIEQALVQAEKNVDKFDEYYKKLSLFREKIKEKRNVPAGIVDRSIIGSYNIFDLDETKVVLYKNGMSGEELYMTLYEKYKLQLEKREGNTALALTTIFDTDEGFERLYNALKEI